LICYQSHSQAAKRQLVWCSALGASNKKPETQSHNSRAEFDKSKKRNPKDLLEKYIRGFKLGYICKPHNTARKDVLEKDDDTGLVTTKRKSNLRSAPVTVQSDALELKCTDGIYWLYCSTCKVEVSASSPADVGIHLTSPTHAKNLEQKGSAGKHMDIIKEVLCEQSSEERALLSLSNSITRRGVCT
jgi:hypothetical protein